jgi:hypothetical protein
MRTMVAAAFLLGASASLVVAQGGGDRASGGGPTGSGGAALGGAPAAAAPASNPGAAGSGAPVPPELNRLNGVGSLPTTRRETKGYDDGFTACMAMWEGGSTGLTKEQWTRTCNLARIPPPPASRR